MEHKFLFRYRLWIFFLVAVILVVFLSFTKKELSASPLTKEAEKFVSLCANEESRPLCYDREIPKLMDRGFTMEETFTVTTIIQGIDPSYHYCHVLGHRLAEKETAKDPSKWIEVVHRAPQGVCSNGGIHGAFQERFRTESMPEAKIEELKPILSGVCQRSSDWNPTRMGQATCTHALGHLAMYVTAANTPKSLEICDDSALNEGGYDFRQLCYDGVFMQTYQPLEPEDYTLIEGKEVTKATRDAFCASYSGKRKSSCISESWPLYNKEIKTASGAETFCSGAPDTRERNRCLRGVFYVVTEQMHFAEKDISNYCAGFSLVDRNLCFANAASRMIETDWRNIERSVQLCELSRDYGAETGCYDELVIFSTYNFPPESAESAKLCSLLPSPWKEKCDERRQSAIRSV